MKWNYYAISSSYAATASYALNASSTNTGSLLLNASALQNVITFTRGNGSVFNVTVATGSSISSAFPYTGSAQITGSLGITGSFFQQGSANIFLKGLINQVNPTSHVVMLDNTTGQLYITASSALGGGGGGGGTPGGLTGQIQYNNAGAFGGVSTLIFDGTTLRATGSFSGSFTGILIGTASQAYTASYVLNAVSASYVQIAQTASYYKVFPYTGSAIISGSLIITGSTSITSGSLSVNKSGSTVVDIQGSQGQLFSIVDSLSGSLMSVNDVSGLPILEVFSDDRVVIGTYGAPGLIVSASRVSATGSFSGSFTGSLFGTSSWANNAITASFARTASYVNPLVQSVFISGSTQITGSTIIKGDFSVNSAATVDFNTNVLNINAPLITVPTFATPYSPSVNIRTVMYDAVSNALFVTSSLPGTGGGGTGLSNFISTGSITASVNTDINNLFLVKSGSVDLLKINSEKVLITFTQSATPTPIIGGIFISSSGDLFFGI